MPITPLKPFLLLLFALLIFIAAPVSPSLSEVTSAKQPFTIDDYFKIKRITELALSSDGEMIAYAVASQSLEENKNLQHIYISEAVPGAKVELIEDIQDAYSLAWIPGRHELAFMSGREGTTQIFSYDLSSKAIRQHSESENPVTKFSFAPDGQSFAYISQAIPDSGPSLYDQLQTGDSGVLIDSDITSVYNFINPDWPDLTARPSRNLWVSLAEKLPFQAKIPGNVKDFHWSSDERNLSAVYVASGEASKLWSDRLTSLGIYDVGQRSFRILAAAGAESEKAPMRYYDGGEWIPGEHRVLVRRITERDLWIKESHWTLIDLQDKKPEGEKNTWHEIEYSYQDNFIPVNGSRIHVTKMVQAVSSLYQLTPSGIKRSGILQGVKGSISHFQFGLDFDRAVFVNESLTHPPEIHIWHKGQGYKQLTSINTVIANRLLPKAKEVIWESKDGTKVHGWIMTPNKLRKDGKPWPLITFVHGGPGHAMPNKFAYYFSLWPYPFEVYALNDMVVFLPNYRGTDTYGKQFSDPARIDGEPVDDIISGIDYLIQQGIADPGRLAISGQSHGAWLAPMVMTRKKIFQAGSFAEGAGNAIVNYNLMPGRLNTNVHDVIFESSVYDNPQRYIELSPEMQFKDLETAVLFEAGARVSSVNMLGYLKAARNAGMPGEYIVYPKTGHGMTIPRLREESMERNLDWFRFWLKGEEDSNPAKEEQYQRWRKMRCQQKKYQEVANGNNTELMQNPLMPNCSGNQD